MRSRLNGLAITRSPGICAALGVLIAVSAASSGCSTRAVSITQANLINNANIRDGEPLEVTVVCVHPDDLENPDNQLLQSGSTINSKVWYQRRPSLSGSGSGITPFQLIPDRIFVFTDDQQSEVYGTKLGAALRGADHDGRSLITRKISSRDGFWRSGSVIYVFAAFSGPEGVLPVAPATFAGHQKATIDVEIGLIESQLTNRNANYGQFIKRVAPSQR